MKKVVINDCYGGFELSHKAIMRYAELKGFKLYVWAEESTKKIYETDDIEELIKRESIGLHYTKVPYEEYQKLKEDYEKSNQVYFTSDDIEREDKILIQVVEELKSEANGKCSNLRIVEIPEDVKWHIEEYDGLEHIAEDHRTWY